MSGSGIGHARLSQLDVDDQPALGLLAQQLAQGEENVVASIIVECCRVAERLFDILTSDGLTFFANTSGSRGMQLCCGITTNNQ